MSAWKGRGLSLSQADVDFLMAAVAPEVKDKARLGRLIQEDEDFRAAFIGDEKTYQRVMADEEVWLKISPRLYFEILLRKARRELERIGHTIERAGAQKVAIFDVNEVADLLSHPALLIYLADMLSSFTKIESYTLSLRLKKGLWRKIRFNDMDLDALKSLCQWADEEHRLGFFKRIADLCLFILGVFPEYVHLEHRYPHTQELRPKMIGRTRHSVEEYEKEGRRFYELAASHPAAKAFDLSEVFDLLGERFHTAQKPLNFIAEHYLLHQRRRMFGFEAR